MQKKGLVIDMAVMNDNMNQRERAVEFENSEEGQRIMRVFGQYKTGLKNIDKYEHIIERLESEVGNISATKYDREKVDRTPDVHAGVEDDSMRLVSIREGYEALCKKMEKLKEQITELTDKYVTDDIENFYVKTYYLSDISMKAIGEMVCCNKTTVREHILLSLSNIVLPDDMVKI